MQKYIQVCIPTRKPSAPTVTIASLMAQIGFHSWETYTQFDEGGRGAPWARNQAWSRARSHDLEGFERLILWSDDDINWYPDALNKLTAALDSDPTASYAYGAWQIEGGPRAGLVQCNRPFSGPRLLRGNYISTMSLMRAEHFPGWDEDLHRLQDWELYLRMWLEHRRHGVYCGSIVFSSGDEGGITASGHAEWQRARDYIAQKHGLDTPRKRMVRK
jgi:hypothetical protein